MQIIIQGKQMDVSPRLRQYIEHKAQKLSRLVPAENTAARFEVTVNEEHTRSAHDRFSAQILLTGSSHPIRSEVNAQNINAAFDQALDKVIAQLGRYKDRRTSTKKHRTPGVRVLGLTRAGAISTLDEVNDEEEMTSDDSYSEDMAVSTVSDEYNEEMWTQITEIRSLPTKPMTDKEAIVELEAQSLPFYPFFNEETNSVNVMYRLAEGRYGLLVPALV